MENRGSQKYRGKRIALLIALLMTAAAFLQGCGAGESASEASGAGVPQVLNYGYIGTHAKNFPANAEGWGFHKGIIQAELKKHGIETVHLTAFPNGPDLSESLISGRLDAGSLGDTPAILSRSTGAKTKVITQGTTDSIGYLVARKGGPASLEELKGKTVATQKGSFHHRYLAGLLKKEGLAQDVKVIHLLRVDAEAALARGEIDAMTNTGVYTLKQIDEGYTLLDDATKHPELYGTGVTVVSEAYLAISPEFAKAWNEARSKALEDVKKHPDEYYRFLAELQNTKVEYVKQVSPIERIKEVPFTEEGVQLLEGTKAFLLEEKLAETDFSLDDWLIRP